MHLKPCHRPPPAGRSVATASLLLLATLASSAQVPPATPAPAPGSKPATTAPGEVVELGAFTVSAGFAGSLVAAAETKLAASSITEVIASEDIGKLPDISIAESIARLPGLAAQRVAGRAQVISVRGLSPDFATTLLNGREQVSTGDNRGVEFDQYPSELISSVTVFKTPDASLVGQGLSGTLDMKTVRPLSFGKRTMAFNVRGEYNSLTGLGSDSKHTGNRISGTYIDQFANKTVGVAVGYAHLESPILSQEFGTYGWNNNARPGVPAGTRVTDGLKTFARSGTNTRDGVIGVLQWRPNPQFTSMVDAYYSKFTHEETNRGLETNLGDYNGGNSPGLLYTSTTVRNGVLVGGTASGLYPLVRNIYNDREDKLTALGWNGQYRWDKWTVVGDASYSKAERHELNMETQAQYRGTNGLAVLDTATYQLGGGGFPTATYGLGYTDPARIQIGPSIYGAGYGKVPMVKDELESYKVQVSHALASFIDNVDAGVNFGDRQKRKRQPEQSLNAGAFQPIAGDVILGDTKLGFAGAPHVVSWDVPRVLSRYYDPFVPSDNAFGYLIQKTWKVEEKITTYFAQGNLNTQLGSLHLRGNAGLQIKSVDQSSRSNVYDNAAPVGQQVKVNTDGKTYTDVLPSVNLVFDFGNQQIVRAAAAKQVARPRLDQLKSAFEFDIGRSNGLPSGNGGNPRLDPWRATAFDVSWEKYFSKKGYISAAGFYKDLKTYIFDQTTPNYDFSKFTAGNPLASTNVGRFTQPFNGRGGSLKGLELSASVPFNLFSERLDGFGAVASFSRNQSAISVDNTNLGNAITLPGLSRTVTNITVFYEKRGFSARVSQRHRTDFIGEITGFGADRELRYVKGERVVDFQVGYDFKSGPLKGLGVLLQAYNVTDSKYETYQQTKEQVVEYQKYGRTFLLGVNYKL